MFCTQCPPTGRFRSLQLLRKARLSPSSSHWFTEPQSLVLLQSDGIGSPFSPALPEERFPLIGWSPHASEYEFCELSLSFFNLTPSTSSKL